MMALAFAVWTALMALVLAVLALPVAVFVLQVAAACWPARSHTARAASAASSPTAPRPPMAVLVPAHNESAGIGHTVHGLKAQLRADDRLLVVADNCDDDTAALARAAGADVVERQHATQRGKGYALACGIDALRARPPAAVVVIDADCQVRPGSLDLLATWCLEHQAPVQALDLMLADGASGLNRRVAEFAWRVKNWVRPRGAAALGLPCQLMGTGMAFPWPLAAVAPWASGSIVEDMQLGMALARAGHAPVFCEQALVTSHFPDTPQASDSQRTRWEHGHLATIGHQVPGLLATAWRQRDIRLAAMALDLAVPPLALLVLLMGLAWAACGLLAWLGQGTVPWVVASALFGLLGAAVLAAWLGWGRSVLRAWDLLGVPWYVLSKLAVYTRFWSRRQRDWVRTDRR